MSVPSQEGGEEKSILTSLEASTFLYQLLGVYYQLNLELLKKAKTKEISFTL